MVPVFTLDQVSSTAAQDLRAMCAAGQDDIFSFRLDNPLGELLVDIISSNLSKLAANSGSANGK